MSNRINEIAEAATRLFIKQGYSKTQISQIAKEVGISAGAIYLDFVGKKEIMHYILKCTIDPQFSNKELKKPIDDENFIDLEEEIVKSFEKLITDFEKPLLMNLENYSLENLISDAFDFLSRYSVGCLFIEKNQYDFKFLADNYKTYRNRFFNIMENYLKIFIKKGMVRKIDNIEITTILIVEMLTWWAMDIKYSSFETQDIPIDIAKKVCMDNIIFAYKNKKL